MRIQQTIPGLAVLGITTWAGSAMAATALAPYCDTAARVACPNGSMMSYLDISSGACISWTHRAMLSGTYYYQYFGGCPSSCVGNDCNGGAGNHYVVNGSNGWNFRMLHLDATISSRSQTCDRCALGLTGATGNTTFVHSHSENRQYATRTTAWIAPSLSCGSAVACGSVVGSPTL